MSKYFAKNRDCQWNGFVGKTLSAHSHIICTNVNKHTCYALWSTHLRIGYKYPESTDSYIVNAGGAFEEHHHMLLVFYYVCCIRSHTHTHTYTENQRLLFSVTLFHFVICNIHSHHSNQKHVAFISILFVHIFVFFFHFAKLTYFRSSVGFFLFFSFLLFHFFMSVPVLRLHYVPFYLHLRCKYEMFHSTCKEFIICLIQFFGYFSLVKARFQMYSIRSFYQLKQTQFYIIFISFQYCLFFAFFAIQTFHSSAFLYCIWYCKAIFSFTH